MKIENNFSFCHNVFINRLALMYQKVPLNLSRLQTYLQQTTLESIVEKGKRVIFYFATMFSTSYSFVTFIERDIPYFCLAVFKVVCCRFAVCGRGLMSYINTCLLIILIVVFQLCHYLCIIFYVFTFHTPNSVPLEFGYRL